VKVLILTPTPSSHFLGCSATVRRWRDALNSRGHLAELFGTDDDGDLKLSLAGTIGRFKPDLVHAHDAGRMGVGLLGLRLPWVVSVSGEDLHHTMLDERRGAHVCEVFRRAHRVMVPSAEARALLEERIPDAVGKIDVVPRAAVKLPSTGTDLRCSLGIPRTRFVVLLPGGLRPIKGQHRALSLPRLLRASGVDAELILVGSEQDGEYSRSLHEIGKAEVGVRILPALSKERMGASYLDADVVLNTSLSEGMSPTILEAGALARPVVASDVPGNRELVRHKETGLLFATDEEMAKCVLALTRNRSAAGALGVRMREDFQHRFTAGSEIEGLLSSYAAA
jgi:glycosyltransferase involved in cell wall biosynthesis